MFLVCLPEGKSLHSKWSFPAFRRGGDVSKRSQLAMLRRGAQLVVCTAQRLKVISFGSC
jgi:superfamily II DNA/RNA helicase